MDYTKELIPRILRDIDDGVIALDDKGCIKYVNPQCQSLLGLTDLDIGKTYLQVFYNDNNSQKNDAFNQFVIDAVCDKEKTHSGTVVYVDINNNKLHLKITSSFLKGDEVNDNGGVVLVLSNVTETEVYKKKRFDSSVVFSCVTACVCLYILLLSILEFFKISVSTKVLTQVINVMVFAFAIIIYKKTDFTVEELGLKLEKPKRTFAVAILLSAILVGLLILTKLVILKLSPTFFDKDAPFWNWDIGLYSWVSYIFTCVIQEFLARSMVYGSIKKMFDGKNAIIIAVVLSSLLFGAVHIAHGFVYMITAMILLGGLVGVYEKQGNIWGVTVIHFVLGQTAACLGFIA